MGDLLLFTLSKKFHIAKLEGLSKAIPLKMNLQFHKRNVNYLEGITVHEKNNIYRGQESLCLNH